MGEAVDVLEQFLARKSSRTAAAMVGNRLIDVSSDVGIN
jgi:hypothetical protein